MDDLLQTIGPVITALTPIYVPMLVMLVREHAPKWALPMLAIALGAVADILNQVVTGVGVGAAMGAALGGSGVALREVKHQLEKSL